MTLLIDNYDSFSYNLVQLIGGIDPDLQIVRNDALTLEEVKRLAPSRIVISPGPGFPTAAGICEPLITAIKGQVPMLGVCLGHQAICESFGGKIVHAKQLVHGKQSSIHVANGSPIFKGLPPVIQAARYHSLIVEKATLPDELLVTAQDEAGEVMAVKHRDYEIYGVQFHPESILTPQGIQILKNFLELGGHA